MARSQSGSIGAAGVLVAISSAVVIVAAFLAWMTQSGVFGGEQAYAGIDLLDASPIFNGVATAVLALVAGAAALLAAGNEQANVLVAVLGVLIALVAAVVLLSPGTVGLSEQITTNTSPAVGLYVTLLGGIGVTIGGFMSYAD